MLPIDVVAVGVSVLVGDEDGSQRLVAWRSASGDLCKSCGESLTREALTPEETSFCARAFASAGAVTGGMPAVELGARGFDS